MRAPLKLDWPQRGGSSRKSKAFSSTVDPFSKVGLGQQIMGVDSTYSQTELEISK